jgi:hypothetical protein
MLRRADRASTAVSPSSADFTSDTERESVPAPEWRTLRRDGPIDEGHVPRAGGAERYRGRVEGSLDMLSTRWLARGLDGSVPGALEQIGVHPGFG